MCESLLQTYEDEVCALIDCNDISQGRHKSLASNNNGTCTSRHAKRTIIRERTERKRAATEQRGRVVSLCADWQPPSARQTRTTPHPGQSLLSSAMSIKPVVNQSLHPDTLTARGTGLCFSGGRVKYKEYKKCQAPCGKRGQ